MHKGDDGMCTHRLACRTILHKGANEGVSVAKPLRAGIIRMSRGPDGGTQQHCQTTARLEGAGRSPDLLLCPPPRTRHQQSRQELPFAECPQESEGKETPGRKSVVIQGSRAASRAGSGHGRANRTGGKRGQGVLFEGGPGEVRK